MEVRVFDSFVWINWLSMIDFEVAPTGFQTNQVSTGKKIGIKKRSMRYMLFFKPRR